MSIKEDSNVFGRLAALTILVAAGFYAARLCGPSSCPLGKGPKTSCVVR